jgi:hypothetical protein
MLLLFLFVVIYVFTCYQNKYLENVGDAILYACLGRKITLLRICLGSDELLQILQLHRLLPSFAFMMLKSQSKPAACLNVI